MPTSLTQFVAYYRVSTDKQGRSGLGLDALPASQEGLKALRTKTSEYHATVKPLIRELRQQGLTLAAIANELTRRQIPTARGGLWYPATVKNILG